MRMARPREFDEAEVIDAAERVFWTRGYEDTSLSDLLDATGLGRASLYSTFGGKDELLLRVLVRHRRRLDGMLQHLLEPPSGLAGIKRFFHEADHVRLQPENAAMEPIRSKEVRILGRVVGLLRSI